MTRPVSLMAFLGSLAVYPVSFVLTVAALSGTPGGATHGDIAWQWISGRLLAFSVGALLVLSIVGAVSAPPEPRHRIWWAVPATVLLSVLVLFDYLGFGVSLKSNQLPDSSTRTSFAP